MLNQNDKKEIRTIVTEVVGGVLEQIVLPEIQGLKDDVKTLKDDVNDLKDTTTRIELKLNAVVVRQDEQGDDIHKMKKVLKLSVK